MNVLAAGKKRSILWPFFFLQKGYNCGIKIYHLKNGESRPNKVRKTQTNWFTSEAFPYKWLSKQLVKTNWMGEYIFHFFYPLHPVLKKINQDVKVRGFHSKGVLGIGL